MPLKTRLLGGSTAGINSLPPFNIGRPLYFYYVPPYGSNGNIVPNQRMREGPQNNGRYGVVQSINTGTPGIYARAGLRAGNFQNTDEIRFDGSPSARFYGRYPISLFALVRPRDVTQTHYAITLMDPTVNNKRLLIALSNTVSDKFVAQHDDFGGSSTLTAISTTSYVANEWYFVAATFTRSGTTTTATLRVRFPDGSHEVATSSSTGQNDASNLYTRISIGAVSRATPIAAGNMDIAFAGVAFTAIGAGDFQWLVDHPSFFLSREQVIGTFTDTVVQPSVFSPRAQVGTPLASFDRVLQLPWPDWHNTDEHLRQHAEVMEAILEGGLRCVGIVTLDASSLTTVVQERRCGTASVILLSPVTASAGGEVGIWFSGIGTKNASGIPTFTINHGFDTRTDRTFRYFVVGGGGGYV